MRMLIALCISLVIYSHAYLFLFDQQYISIMPGISLLIIIIMGMVSWSLQFTGVSRSPRSELYTVKEKRDQSQYLIWAAIFFVSVSFSYLFSDAGDFALRSWKTFLILIATLMACHWATIDKKVTRAAIYGVILALILAIINNIIEFSGLYEIFTGNRGRSAGFYVNPNISGEMLNLGMIICIAYIPAKYRLRFCILIGLGIFLTFSRSSILSWLIAVFLMSYFNFFKINRYIAIAISMIFITSILLLQMGKVELDKGVVKDLGVDAASRLVYKGKSGSSGDDSVMGRVNEAERAVDLFLEAPFFGHGLGSSEIFRSQPHNTILRLAVEQGAVGSVLFFILFFIIIKRGNKVSLVFAITLFILSMFTHNTLDYPSRWFVILLAMKVNDVVIPKFIANKPLVKNSIS